MDDRQKEGVRVRELDQSPSQIDTESGFLSEAKIRDRELDGLSGERGGDAARLTGLLKKQGRVGSESWNRDCLNLRLAPRSRLRMRPGSCETEWWRDG